jgi:predicted enzyme related to lactoylglutathione lyase
MADECLEQPLSRFRWVDLATVDEAAAKSFYSQMFGWTARDRHVGEGRFTTFAQGGASFASLYQLSRRHMDAGMPSHWTPYVSVRDVAAAAAKACSLGGQVIVPPHDSAGLARVSLICDPAGALIGLWQTPRGTGDKHSRGDA